MRKLTVAMIQSRSPGCDPERNTKVGIAYVRAAKEKGADLVLFPECWVTSYECPAAARSLPPLAQLEQEPEFAAWCENALTEQSAPIGRFCRAARELSVGIVVTGFTRGRRRPRDTAFVIGRDGEIRMRYDKVHTCDFDWERYLESGSGFSVCEFDGVRLGVMICYDREYPESARELMLQGAELILVPNDCGTMEPRLRELSVRAMENMAGIAMANPPGEGAGCSAAFAPMVWDRQGRAVENTIVTAAPDFEGIVTATFDIDAMRAYRRREDLGKYRKVGAYTHLLEEPFGLGH